MNRLFTGALVTAAALWSTSVRADHGRHGHGIVHGHAAHVHVHEHPSHFDHVHVVESAAARAERNLQWRAELAARADEIRRAETAWQQPAILGPMTIARADRPTFSNPAVVIPQTQVAFFRDPYYFMDGRSFDRRSLAFGINANDFYTRWTNANPRVGSEVVYIQPREAIAERSAVVRSIDGRDDVRVGSTIVREPATRIEVR